MIRGRKRPLIKVSKAKADLNFTIHNRFDFYRQDPVTGAEEQIAYAENVICNKLWTRLLAPDTYFNYIHYGTGTGEPAASDMSLFTFLGYGTPSTSDDVYGYPSGMDNRKWSLTRKIQLDTLTANGSTLTEVGIGYSTTAATLCTHAMLKDMNGNAVSIAKTATDIINIYATVYLVLPTISEQIESGIFYSIGTMAFTSNNAINWLLGINASRKPSAIGLTVGGLPYPASTSDGGSVSATYSVANKTAVYTSSRLGISSCNVAGGVGAVYLYCGSAIEQYISFQDFLTAVVGGAWCSGTAITGEAIGTGDGSTKDFSTDFAFASDATIYVDGVAQSGVTVDNSPSLVTDLGRYFVLLESNSDGAKNTIPNPIGTEAQGGANICGVYYNPLYATGITSFTGGSTATVYVSDDMVTWTQIASGSGSKSVPSAYQKCKFWKIVGSYSLSLDTGNSISTLANSGLTVNNIHFTTAPTSGAVITADYTTKTIPKDANHVLDLSVTLTFGVPA